MSYELEDQYLSRFTCENHPSIQEVDRIIDEYIEYFDVSYERAERLVDHFGIDFLANRLKEAKEGI